MSMPVLALFSRSLNMDHRKFTTYLARMALVMVVLLFIMAIHSSPYRVSAPGLRFFTGVVGTSLFFISFVGISLFSSVITEEKEEQTLGLLKMTGLSPVSILLGKSVSRILGAVLLLLAAFPFALLAVTLGGVSLDQIVAAYCTVLSYTLFLGGLGLFCSVSLGRSKNASGLAFLVLLLFFLLAHIGTPLIQLLTQVGWLSATGRLCTMVGPVVEWVHAASPITRIIEILQTGFSGFPIGFQVLSNLALAVCFFALSWLTFERFTREVQAPAPSRGLVFTRTSILRSFGVGRAWHNALAWKEFYFGAGGRIAVLARCLLFAALITLVGWIVWRQDGPDDVPEALGSVLMVMSPAVAYFELIAHAGSSLSKERKWQTLSEIMVLPMSTRGIVFQRLKGSLVGMTPYPFFFALGVLLAPGLFLEGMQGLLRSGAIFLILAEAVFFLYLTAWLSLVFKRVGLLVAFGMMYLANGLGVGLFSVLVFILSGGRYWEGNETAGIIFGAVLAAALVYPVHRALMRRVERLAGE